MLPDYKPEPPRTGSFKKVVALMLLATVGVAGYFLVKPKSPTQMPDYKLQSKIQEPVAIAIKNDKSFIDELKKLTKSDGKDKLAKRIQKNVNDQATDVTKSLSVEVPDRVKENAQTVLNKRLSEFIWKPGTAPGGPKRYVPGNQRPLSPPPAAPVTKPKGGKARREKPAAIKSVPPSKTGIPSMENR